MRIDELLRICKRCRLDSLIVRDEANLRALTGIECDNAILLVEAGDRPAVTFFTDFRYQAMVRRVAPSLKVRDLARFQLKGRRVGFESSQSQARFAALQRLAPRAKFVDVAAKLLELRATKTSDEIRRLRAAQRLNFAIWEAASAQFRAGMTEREMARVIQHLMIERGEGEAFETIVCVGKNAAECHHRPDDTVWNGREPILVDMGVKLDGVCSDLTRNLVPRRAGATYRRVYELVAAAQQAALAAARPGLTAKALDKVARDVIRKGGFGNCFGHALGHGVGFEIHEAPTISKKGTLTLRPGMVFTLEPGVYLEDNLGVRIEDMVVITETGCEIL